MGLGVTSYVNFIYVAHVSIQVVNKSDTSQVRCHACIVYAHSLLAECILHRGEVSLRRTASTAMKSSARIFLNVFLRHFQKHENYRKRRGKVGYFLAWKRLGAYTPLPTEWLGGEES